MEHKKKEEAKHLVTAKEGEIPRVTLDKVHIACQDVQDPELRSLLKDVVAWAG